MINLDSILKSRYYFAKKGLSSQGYGFSISSLPAFTASLAMAVTILELLAIFSAHWMASSTTASTGKILLTRPTTQKGKRGNSWF